MRILQIRRINLPKLPPKPLLLLPTNPTLSSLLVAPTVLPYVVQPPGDDQDELQAERYGGADGSGDCRHVIVSVPVSNRSLTASLACKEGSDDLP